MFLIDGEYGLWGNETQCQGMYGAQGYSRFMGGKKEICWDAPRIRVQISAMAKRGCFTSKIQLK